MVVIGLNCNGAVDLFVDCTLGCFVVLDLCVCVCFVLIKKCFV